MNCQKGDLAVIVGSISDEGKKYLGCIVRCVSPRMHSGIDFWLIEPRLVPNVDEDYWSDANLKPLRDPGPSAVDETIQRLGTPMDMRLRELESEIAKLNDSLDRLEKVLTR